MSTRLHRGRLLTLLFAAPALACQVTPAPEAVGPRSGFSSSSDGGSSSSSDDGGSSSSDSGQCGSSSGSDTGSSSCSCACASPPEEEGGTDGDGDGTSTGEAAGSTGGSSPGGTTGTTSAGSTGPAADRSEVAPAFVANDDPVASKDCGDKTNWPPLPGDCTGVGGTGLTSIRWLECHRQSALENPWCTIGGTDWAVSNGVNGNTLAQIVNNCSEKPTDQEKLLCAGTNCDVALGGFADVDDEYNCKHHAACVDDVLDALDISHSNEGSMTHAYTEVRIDTNGNDIVDSVMVMDSYNDIYYVCSL
jgi:hypothetical protein